jgi:uncharacterized membrane protein YkvA (DUF1232 family)
MGRLLQFRRELALLWRAFMSAETPVWLKALMLLVPAYLISPIDLVPDFIPLAGWLDDMIVIPLMVSWIVSLIPQPAARNARAWQPEDAPSSPRGETIEGEWRRL